MIRINVRNKWISLRGSSYVTDDKENKIYKVQGKFWTVTQKKFVQDLQGNLLYTVRNKFWKFITYYAMIYDSDGKEIARLRRKIFSLHDHFDVTCSLGKLVVEGNILGFDYHIFLNGDDVGHVGRHISLRDSFFVDIDDFKIDPAFVIALVIAIDNITDERRSDAASSSY